MDRPKRKTPTDKLSQIDPARVDDLGGRQQSPVLHAVVPVTISSYSAQVGVEIDPRAIFGQAAKKLIRPPMAASCRAFCWAA